MRRIFLVLFLAFLCSLQGVSAAVAAERILEMDVTARVRADASLVVTERIVFVAEHVEIRRGLIREIPIVVNKGGRRIAADFSLLDAKLDGRPVHYELYRAGRNMEIHLGDDSYLSRGQHEYVVTYRMTDQLLFHDDADELYWNVTGSDWIFPIDHAAFRVELPRGAVIVESDAATGRPDAKGTNWRRNPDGLAGPFETTRGLAPGDGFTVMVAWPKGFVTPPQKTGLAALVDRFGFDNLLLASALFVFACYALLWFFVGRDPKRGVVYPVWNPPDDLEPAYIGYARHLEFGTNLLLADLIDLAVRGYVTLEPRGENLIVRRAAVDWTTLSPPHGLLMHALFPDASDTRRLGGDPDIVGHDNARFTRKLLRLLPSFYKAARKEPLVKKNRLASFAALFSFAPMLLLIAHTLDTSDPTLIPFAVLLFIGGFFLQAVLNQVFKVLPASLRAFRRTIKRKRGGAFFSYLLAIFSLTVVFASYAYFAAILVYTFSDLAPSGWGQAYFPLACIGFALASAAFFSWHMQTRTAVGRALLDKVEGFELYLETAERHRLEALYPAELLSDMPERTPQLFERLLPYAFALGVAETWADGFASILEAADYNPAWQSEARFNAVHFSSAMRRMERAMRPPSSSGGSGSGSGRGGGTSSGGGFGGGGGRGR